MLSYIYMRIETLNLRFFYKERKNYEETILETFEHVVSGAGSVGDIGRRERKSKRYDGSLGGHDLLRSGYAFGIHKERALQSRNH